MKTLALWLLAGLLTTARAMAADPAAAAPAKFYFEEERVINGLIYRVVQTEADEVEILIINPTDQTVTVPPERNILHFYRMDYPATVEVEVRKKNDPTQTWRAMRMETTQQAGAADYLQEASLPPHGQLNGTQNIFKLAMIGHPAWQTVPADLTDYEYRVRVFFNLAVFVDPSTRMRIMYDGSKAPEAHSSEYLMTGWKTFAPVKPAAPALASSPAPQ